MLVAPTATFLRALLATQTPQNPDAAAPALETQTSWLGEEVWLGMGWVDITAAAVLVLFVLLGLFKGTLWQLGRMIILVIAFVVTGLLGERFGGWLLENMGNQAAADAPFWIYISCISIFAGSLVLLSLIGLLFNRDNEDGLSMGDRLFGGVLGIATGAAFVLAGLGVVFMFFSDDGDLVQAARASKSGEFSSKTMNALGEIVPQDVREAYVAGKPSLGEMDIPDPIDPNLPKLNLPEPGEPGVGGK